jgi:hypothetical protein
MKRVHASSSCLFKRRFTVFLPSMKKMKRRDIDICQTVSYRLTSIVWTRCSVTFIWSTTRDTPLTHHIQRIENWHASDLHMTYTCTWHTEVTVSRDYKTWRNSLGYWRQASSHFKEKRPVQCSSTYTLQTDVKGTSSGHSVLGIYDRSYRACFIEHFVGLEN